MFMGFMACGCGYKTGELIIKYFITQVFISLFMTFLFIVFFFGGTGTMSQVRVFILMSKLGIFPFHGWMLAILGKVEWWGYYFISTFLKLIPILLIYYSIDSQNLWFILVLGGRFGGVLGLNNLVVQKLFGYSSIVHLSWILASLLVGTGFFWCYMLRYIFIIYYIVVLCLSVGSYYVNHLKFNSSSFFVKLGFVLIVLRLGGFPPLLGFLFKWIVVIRECIISDFVILSILAGSTLALFFYLQLVYYFIIIYSLNTKWNKFNLFGTAGPGLFISLVGVIIIWFIWL